MSKSYRIPLLCSLGNMLELYDYTLYGILLVTLSQVFFPHDNLHVSHMLAMASFGLSFLVAPFGAMIWGRVGDLLGRKTMLVRSLLLMAVPSFLIACLPTYAMIGWLAPCLLFLCRVMQVISASGELKGAKIFAMEHMGEGMWGRVSGMISASVALGVALAMTMGWLVVHFKDASEHIWRLPFFLSCLLAVMGMIIRSKMKESPAFEEQKKAAPFVQAPFVQDYWALTTRYGRECFLVFLLGGFLGTLSYTMFAFMHYLLTQRLMLPANLVFALAMLGLLGTAIAAIGVGVLVDKKGGRIMMCITLLLAACGGLPAMALIATKSGGALMVAHGILGGLLGAYGAVSTVVMAQLFPSAVRCRGVMFYYAVGVAIFGGMTPLLFANVAMLPFGIYGVGAILSTYALLVFYYYKKVYTPSSSISG
jgi:MHS family proline/betaine transporter-like MFS transporter